MCLLCNASVHFPYNSYAYLQTARGAEESKRRKYAVLGERYRFEPLAVETAGVFGATTAYVLSEIGRRITGVTGEARETLWLKQRIGLAVQRGNAFSILAAAGAGRPA